MRIFLTSHFPPCCALLHKVEQTGTKHSKDGPEECASTANANSCDNGNNGSSCPCSYPASKQILVGRYRTGQDEHLLLSWGVYRPRFPLFIGSVHRRCCFFLASCSFSARLVSLAMQASTSSPKPLPLEGSLASLASGSVMKRKPDGSSSLTGSNIERSNAWEWGAASTEIVFSMKPKI